MVKDNSIYTVNKSVVNSAICGILFSSSYVNANPNYFDELTNLSLEALLNISVSSASGTEESYKDAPAAMVIITADNIKKRGYSNLKEIFYDLPGFDNVDTNNFKGLISYQRGYRTPATQRTLIMINGIVDNHLWTHSATIDKYMPLSGIERIEVLYGPAGAVYGPNAFLGIVNIITKDASNHDENHHKLDLTLQTASFNHNSLEAYAAGRMENFSYNIAAKIDRSDEAGIDDLAPWGFVNQQMMSDPSIWGPIVTDDQLSSRPYGQYQNDSKNHGILADLHYKDLTFGLINWKTGQGYGPYYPSDRAQTAGLWYTTSKQYYLRHQYQRNDNHQIKHLIAYRKSDYYGDWGEASPDNSILTGPDALSYISISNWNSVNNSWLFKQDHQYQYDDTLKLVAGLKFERKELTKAYDVCGYWAGSFCSSFGGEDDGGGIATSRDDTITIRPKPLNNMPSANIATTQDKGIYLQGIWSLEQWRINSGIRYDTNNIYGSTVNPRASAVYYYSEQTTLKLLYGTAFQEPSPVQLWGGWNGRQANSNLASEKTQNLELIIMHQDQNWLHDISIFTAHYDNVIKEEAENAGERKTYGLEYRGNFHYDNFIENADEITGYLYYTYTKAYSTVTYDHQNELWLGAGINNCEQINQQHTLNLDACQDFNVDIGDIAPHKINFGINLPLNEQWQVNLRANYVSDKTLYLRNTLRAQGRKNASNFIVNSNISYNLESLTIAFKVNNLFDRNYYHSGPESGNAGTDTSQRSAGWHNSLIPQVGRNYSVTLNYQF